jgi:hypothetical protein
METVQRPVNVHADLQAGGVLVRELTFDMETSGRAEKPRTSPNNSREPTTVRHGRWLRMGADSPPSELTPQRRPMSLGRPQANQS